VYDGYQAQWPAGRGQVWAGATYEQTASAAPSR
jgi:hypothetical protein